MHSCTREEATFREIIPLVKRCVVYFFSIVKPGFSVFAFSKWNHLHLENTRNQKKNLLLVLQIYIREGDGDAVRCISRLELNSVGGNLLLAANLAVVLALVSVGGAVVHFVPGLVMINRLAVQPNRLVIRKTALPPDDRLADCGFNVLLVDVWDAKAGVDVVLVQSYDVHPVEHMLLRLDEHQLRRPGHARAEDRTAVMLKHVVLRAPLGSFDGRARLLRRHDIDPSSLREVDSSANHNIHFHTLSPVLSTRRPASRETFLSIRREGEREREGERKVYVQLAVIQNCRNKGLATSFRRNWPPTAAKHSNLLHQTAELSSTLRNSATASAPSSAPMMLRRARQPPRPIAGASTLLKTLATCSAGLRWPGTECSAGSCHGPKLTADARGAAWRMLSDSERRPLAHQNSWPGLAMTIPGASFSDDFCFSASRTTVSMLPWATPPGPPTTRCASTPRSSDASPTTKMMRVLLSRSGETKMGTCGSVGPAPTGRRTFSSPRASRRLWTSRSRAAAKWFG